MKSLKTRVKVEQVSTKTKIIKIDTNFLLKQNALINKHIKAIKEYNAIATKIESLKRLQCAN